MSNTTATPPPRRSGHRDETMSGNSMAVLETKVDHLIRQGEENRDAIQSLERAVTKLAVIEERQASDRHAIDRAFGEIGIIKATVAGLERKAPINDMTNTMLGKVLMIIVTAVVGALLGIVIIKPSAQPIVFQQPPAAALPAPTAPQPPTPQPANVQ